jgi:hypothetical protein
MFSIFRGTFGIITVYIELWPVLELIQSAFDRILMDDLSILNRLVIVSQGLSFKLL